MLLRDKTKNLPNPPSIVFTTVTDPVELKLVARLEKPGGNLTGMAGQTSENDPVRLQMLVELGSGFTGARKIVKGDTIGVFLAYDRPGKVQQYRKVEEKAAELSLDLKLDPKDANDLADIEKHFEHFKKLSVKGVVVAANSLFNDLRADVVKIANKSGLPTIYQWRQFVDAGGLVSFGPDILQAYDMAGQYVTRILDGRETPTTMECSTPDPSTVKRTCLFALHMSAYDPKRTLAIHLARHARTHIGPFS